MSSIIHFIDKLLIKNYFWRANAQSFFINIVAYLLVWVSNIVLIRWAGEEINNTYINTVNWINLLGMIALAGTDDLLMREIPIAWKEKNKIRIQKIIRWGRSLILFSSSITVLVAGLLIYFFDIVHLKKDFPYFLIGFPIVFLFTLLHFHQTLLRASFEMSKGQMTEKILKPTIQLCFIGVCSFLLVKKSVNILLYTTLFSFLITYLVAYTLWKKYWTEKQEGLADNTSLINYKYLYISSLYFMINSVFYLLHTRLDSFFVGYICAKDLTKYTLALKFAELVIFPAGVINLTITPMFSSLYHEQDIKGLRALLWKAQGLIMLSMIPIILGFVFLGKWLFFFFYGENFVAAYPILLILAVAQFLNGSAAPLWTLLLMTGKERKSLYILIISTCLSFLINYIAVSNHGIYGAAYASGASFLILFLFLLLANYTILRGKQKS